MDEFDSFINIDTYINTNDTDYILKSISLDNGFNINTPFKVTNVSRLNPSKFKNNIEGIVETTKYINTKKSYDALYNLLENPPNNQKSALNQFFKINTLFKSLKSVISLSFSKNPFVSNEFSKGRTKPLTNQNFEFLLDYIHEYSTFFVLVPDINFNSFDSFEEYKSYIENSVNILSSFNNKPIFVPLSMKLDYKLLDNLLYFYHQKNYSNIWFNFNSAQINTKISNIRFIFRRLENYFKKTAVTYFSNMRKEISKNNKSNYVRPSDILSPFLGCDFVGANREMGFGPKEKRTKEEKIAYNLRNKLNQNRIFDPSTYYYYSIPNYPIEIKNKDEILNTKGLSDIINSNIINQELNLTKKHVEENKNLGSYLKNKKMFLDDEVLKKDLIPIAESQSSLKNFFKYL